MTAGTFEFTSGGDFITSAGTTSVTYKYSAANGVGKYWIVGAESAKVDFSYVITNNTLDLTIAGSTVKGLVKR